ncbi:MAG: hypothetical protein ALAOOOJD_00972 [bacterium]|nr:hypothetical protein [bacterium]
MIEKETQEITFAAFFATLVKWRKLILRNFIILTIASLIIALLLPKWYTSSATLLPPETESGSSLGALSLMADLPFNLKSLIGGGTSPSELYLGILRSRNLREAIVKKLDLMALWKVELMSDALRTLDDLTELDQTEEGLISIATTAQSKELAQKLAQTYVDELDRVNRNIRFSTAKQTREFIEKRLKEAEDDMRRTAGALRDFQKQHGVISLEEQTKASIKAAAELRAQMVVKEMEYAVLRQQFSESHDQIKLLKSSLEAMRQQLERVEVGANGVDEVLIPFSSLPDLGMQYIFLLRDTEVQKVIYKLLAQQYEEARIREMRDTPTVQLLDTPALPERKSKPKRLYYVLAGMLLSFLVSGFVIFFNNYLDRLRTTDPENYNRLLGAYESLRADLRWLLPSKRRQPNA